MTGVPSLFAGGDAHIGPLFNLLDGSIRESPSEGKQVRGPADGAALLRFFSFCLENGAGACYNTIYEEYMPGGGSERGGGGP